METSRKWVLGLTCVAVLQENNKSVIEIVQANSVILLQHSLSRKAGILGTIRNG